MEKWEWKRWSSKWPHVHFFSVIHSTMMFRSEDKNVDTCLEKKRHFYHSCSRKLMIIIFRRIRTLQNKLIPFLLVSPELSIQSSVSRMTMQIQLICIITARPLTYAKWKHEGIELNQIRRLEINDFTIQLTLLISVSLLLNNQIILNFVNLKKKIDPSDVTNIFGLYECIAENQLKLSKAFIMIDSNSFF